MEVCSRVISIDLRMFNKKKKGRLVDPFLLSQAPVKRVGAIYFTIQSV